MRQIEQKMVRWLDAKLKNNGLAQHAITAKDPRTLFRLAGEACVGVREVGGNNRGPMVELMQETLGNAGFESWCMSFVQTCVAYAELKTGIHSPVWPSEHCLTVWHNTPIKQRVKFHPLAGAIVIWRHGSSTAGHTGIVLSCDDKIFHAVEGNTEGGSSSPKGPVVRDGGGVYYTTRGRTGTGSMRVVGFLKPFE